ncbi:uncharacterized protein LOC113341341 [Papaver somniferum]|uniref:uncharacterized protein LOC113341341 n=1 Tax=Papaver somniferum TaxID=3469 RepID=UPI000E704884|nr:uncharacterized protein LOC113341341 [Papaver somniferum]
MINQAGRTTQVNAVLSTMGMFQMQILKLPETTIHHMDSIQRRYWWNNFTNDHPRHLIGWKKVCVPKRFGGLCLKNLTNYNSALLAKLAWQLLHNQDAIWEKLLKGKYLPHNDLQFFPTPETNNSSWVWQSICVGLEIVLRNAKWQVGNGTRINIWTANWIPSMQTAIQDWSDLNTSNIQWVSELLDPLAQQWNIPLLRHLFSADQVNSILTIPLQLDQEDKLVWPFTSTGMFTTASA